MSELLNEPQERTLKSTFVRLEELLDSCEELRRKQANDEGVFVHHTEHLSQEQCEQLSRQEESARQMLGEFKETFSLSAETTNKGTSKNSAVVMPNLIGHP